METKELLLNSIKHKSIDKIPMMFRAVPSVYIRLCNYFGLKDPNRDWENFIKMLGADVFSNGETLGAFTTYVPKYIGPKIDNIYEPNHFFIWGIKPEYMDLGNNREIIFHNNPPLADLENEDDLEKYPFPSLKWFDFCIYKRVVTVLNESFEEQLEISSDDLESSEKYFINTFCFNSIFMTSIFIRGFDKMLMDLLTNERLAKKLIDIIGQFYLDFAEKNLSSIGEKLDLYGIWDDFATQDGLMLSPDLWRKFYKPWYNRIIRVVKKYKLLISFHVCGNCTEIIPDLIEIGIDILDPIQTSAKNMDFQNLYNKFGKDICFHGGIDAQKFLKIKKSNEIVEEIKRIKSIFEDNSSIILGPSHYLTPDIPLENILAIYK